jgi:hypothetical protein
VVSEVLIQHSNPIVLAKILSDYPLKNSECSYNNEMRNYLTLIQGLSQTLPNCEMFLEGKICISFTRCDSNRQQLPEQTQ